ncbi:hypothetical protein ACFL0V_07115, partial [Nanoarchaeota archaeon]
QAPFTIGHKHIGWIAMSGAITNMLFAIILKTIWFANPSEFLLKAVNINIWLALWNMVPFPPFNGAYAFFGSRYIYIFTVGFMAGAAAILNWISGFWAMIAALLVGLVAYILFFVFVDKNWK